MPHPASKNETPYAVEQLHLVDEDASPLLAVVIKGTFAIGLDGRCTLSEEQVPLTLTGEFFGKDPATSSFKYEPEVAFFKSATDVVMNGHAYAPRSGTSEMVVSLRVGPVQKQVRVSGERAWYRAGGKIAHTRPSAFEKIPLVYERAFGGWDRSHQDPKRHTCEPCNPVGTGHRSSGIFEEGIRLPNLEMPEHALRNFGESISPAAFGFICPHWQPRAALAGTYDERWQKNRSPLLPKDFDRRHLNAASPGLVAPCYLRGDEPVTVAGASATGRPLAFQLPGLSPPYVRVAFRHQTDQRMNTSLDTIIIEPDEMRVLLLWRTHLTLQTGPHDLAAIVVSSDAPVR